MHLPNYLGRLAYIHKGLLVLSFCTLSEIGLSRNNVASIDKITRINKGVAMRSLVSCLALAIGIATASLPVQAAVPTTLNYQGQLSSAAGVPVNSAVSMTFSLYNAASGGTALWSEAQSITVNNGLYSVTLGQTTPLTPAMFGVPLYLGTKVGSDAEMTPRIAMTSSATALRAQLADSISCTGCITAAQLDPSVMSAGVVPSGALITSTSTTSPAGYRFTGSNLRNAASIWTPKAPLPSMMSGSVCTSTLNNKLYVFGTSTSNGGNLTVVYDPLADAWISKASLPSGINYFAMNCSSYSTLNNKVYVFGTSTSNGGNLTEVYDPVADVWTSKAPLPSGINWGPNGTVTTVNNKLYVFGTSTSSGGNLTEVYDPAADAWTSKAPLPSGINWGPGNGTVTTVNNKFYVFGTSTSNGGNLTEMYDPVGDAWTSKASLPGMAYSNYSTLAITLNNKLYVLAPSTSIGSNLTEVYDPVADAWTSKAPFPSAINFGQMVTTLNGLIYIFGSSMDLMSILTTAYDPVADTWAAKTSAPFVGTATVLNGLIYMVSTNLINYAAAVYDPTQDFPLYVHVKQ
jgi:hypothetical protein